MKKNEGTKVNSVDDVDPEEEQLVWERERKANVRPAPWSKDAHCKLVESKTVVRVQPYRLQETDATSAYHARQLAVLESHRRG